MLACERRPVEIQAPAHAQIGERQQRGEGRASKSRQGSDLPRSESRVRRRRRRRRVTGHAACEAEPVRGLRKVEREALDQEQEVVQKAFG